MLDIDIRPAGQGAAVVIMTYGTALLRGLRCIDRGIVGHIMTMRMAVEVVRRMTIGAIARCGARQLGRVVMADITVVMLDVVGRVHKVRVIHRGAMTAATCGLLRDQGCMILSVRCPVTGLAAVARGTIHEPVAIAPSASWHEVQALCFSSSAGLMKSCPRSASSHDSSYTRCAG